MLVVALLAAGGGAYLLSRGGSDTPTEDIASGAGPGEDVEVATAESAQPAADEEMVAIPAGTFTLGSDKPEPNAAETLTLTKDLPAFFIDTFEVSNEQFQQFVAEKEAAAPLSWPGGRFPTELAARPVQGVSFDWAQAYCASLGKRLPSEAEWEAAARGNEARVFPWGANAADGKLPDSGTYDRGTLPTNVSALGVFDLTGNAWEWVGESYDKRVDSKLRILRGGQNGYLRKSSVRLPVSAESNALKIAGFRCAADKVDPDAKPLSFGEVALPEKGNEPATTTLPAGVLFRDTFEDATSGWVESATDTNRKGYHPNGFFHLETKTENAEVTVESSVALDPSQKVSVAGSVFVDPANTSVDAGLFIYGLLFRSSLAKDGKALIFVVDARSNAWLVCSRDPVTGKWVLIEKKSRTIPDTVNLEVRMSGPDTYQFLIDGSQVFSQTIGGFTGTGAGMALVSYAGSKKAHVHFDEFQIRQLG